MNSSQNWFGNMLKFMMDPLMTNAHPKGRSFSEERDKYHMIASKENVRESKSKSPPKIKNIGKEKRKDPNSNRFIFQRANLFLY